MTDCEIHNGGRAVMRLRETNLFVNGLFIAGCNAGCQFSIMRTHAGSTGGGQDHASPVQPGRRERAICAPRRDHA